MLAREEQAASSGVGAAGQGGTALGVGGGLGEGKRGLLAGGAGVGRSRELEAGAWRGRARESRGGPPGRQVRGVGGAPPSRSPAPEAPPPEAPPPSPTSAAGEAAVRGVGQRSGPPRSPALRPSPAEQTVLTWCRCASASPMPRRRHGSGRSARGGRTGVGSGAPGAPLLGWGPLCEQRGNAPTWLPWGRGRPARPEPLPAPSEPSGPGRSPDTSLLLFAPLGQEWPELGVWPGAAWGRLLQIPRRAALLSVLRPGEGCLPRGSGPCSGHPAGLCAPTTVLYGLSCGE